MTSFLVFAIAFGGAGWDVPLYRPSRSTAAIVLSLLAWSVEAYYYPQCLELTEMSAKVPC
jgi:hypothetical protein